MAQTAAENADTFLQGRGKNDVWLGQGWVGPATKAFSCAGQNLHFPLQRSVSGMSLPSQTKRALFCKYMTSLS